MGVRITTGIRCGFNGPGRTGVARLEVALVTVPGQKQSRVDAAAADGDDDDPFLLVLHPAGDILLSQRWAAAVELNCLTQ